MNEPHTFQSPQIPEVEVFVLLRAIERGEVTITPEADPRNFGFGDLPYKTSNGWTVTVFIDADSWDYIDHVIAPNGQVLDYNDMSNDLQNYGPPDDVVERVYRIGSDHDLRRAAEVAAGPPPKAIDPDRLQALEPIVSRIAAYFALPAERLAELRERVHAAATHLSRTTDHTYASVLARIEEALTGRGFESAQDALRHFGEAASRLALPPSEVDWSALEIPAPAPRKRAGGYTRDLLRHMRRT